MRFDVLTLFPEIFEPTLRAGILGRGLEADLFSVRLHNIRDWAEDRHRVVDDTPYGGGGGMVMKPDVTVKAIRAVRAGLGDAAPRTPVVHLTPQGEVLNADVVNKLARLPGMILLCGNYEGIDERVIELEVDREISIGDYVLTGGELPALIVINAVARKIPGVVQNAASTEQDSFENGLLDYPHYTRPEEFEGLKAPEVLLSGHHAKVEAWRREQAIRRTALRRPDLLGKADLSESERRLAREILEQEEPR